MKVFYPLLCLLFSTVLLAAQGQTSCNSCNDYLFKQNKGQWQNHILYKTELKNGAIFFEQNNITFNLFDTRDQLRIRGNHHRFTEYDPDIDYTLHMHSFKMKFKGATTNNHAMGSQPIAEYFNYYIGNDPKQWASNVTAFTRLSYSDLYHHINLNIATENGALKYIYEVQPQADFGQIQIEFEGTDGIAVDDEGNLLIKTSVGDIHDLKPYAYQIVNGKQIEVACKYILNGNTVSYALPNGYDKNLPLIIDPTLIFSTYSGSTSDNFGYTATYDNQGNGFAAGSVFGIGYPTTTGAYQVNYVGGPAVGGIAGDDIGITKYNPTGTQRLFSTYIGGYGQELPHSLIVNSNDELFLLGTAGDTAYPTTVSAYDRTFAGGPNPGVFTGIAAHYRNGSDIVISRFSANGQQLLASTYVGGSANDGLNYRAGVAYSTQGYLRHNYADEVRGEIDIDRNGNVYVASCTYSADFPRTTGTFQNAIGGGLDACVFKMDANLSTMIWSTTFGGNQNDAAYSVAFDSNDDLYITGGTRSNNFPVTNGTIQNSFGGGNADGYVIHIDNNGQQLLQSTYYGYASYDQIYFVELDKQNNVHVLGQADNSGTNFILNAAYNTPNGGQFITKFNPTLDTIIWSTSFGRGLGTTDISPTAFLVDVCNSIYACGWGSPSVNGNVGAPAGTGGLQVTPGAFQTSTDNEDFYLMVMADDASALTYATFMGGPVSHEHVDGGTSRFDKGGVVYQSVCAGCGSNDDFPTTAGAVSNTNNSTNCNNAVFKFDLDLPLILANFTAPSACRNVPVSFTNLSTVQSSPSYVWSFGDGATSTQTNPTHTYSQTGLFTVTLVINDPTSCNLTDTITKQLFVLGGQSNTTLPARTVCAGQSVQIGVPPTNDPAITYMWTPSNTLSSSSVSNPFATPTQNTTYQLVVSNGICADTFSQAVNIATGGFTISSTQIDCPGDTIVLSANGLAPGSVASYQWQPSNIIVAGANTANPLAVPTGNTTFTLTVVTTIGCTFTQQYNYVYPSNFSRPNADFILPTAACVLDTLTFVNASTGSSISSYNWQFGDGTASNLVNPTKIYTQSGSYTVRLIITDDSTCLGKDTIEKTINILSDSNYVLPTLTICKGSSTPIGLAGNDPSLTYNWQPTTGLSNPNVANPTASPAQTTIYLLVASNTQCADSIYQTVLVVDDSIFTNDDTLVCPSSPIQLFADNTGPSDSMRYEWQPTSNIISGANTATPIVSVTGSTTFTVIGTSEHGCKYYDTVVVSTFPAAVQLNAYANPDTISYGDTTQLFADTAFVSSYAWRDDTTLSATDVLQPYAFPRNTTTYYITASDFIGCAKTDTVTVYVLRTPCAESNIFIPNGFSPNGDGKNDILYVRGNNITKVLFIVYDRWGQKVFESTDLAIGWDGVFKGKKLDPAVFAYYVEGECEGGQQFIKKGNVTLFR